MLLMDHGDGIISHVQSGFNYFSPRRHDEGEEHRHTIRIVGNKGVMGLVGYDWDPHGVDLATKGQPRFRRYATEGGDFAWEMGASLVAECIATGKELLITPEHALHVLELIQAARESQTTGQRIELRSDFRWPVLS